MWWSNGDSFVAVFGLRRLCTRREVIVMPTLLATFCFSGLVVILMFVVCLCFGWFGVCEF